MAENQEQILNVQPQSNEAEQAVLGAMLSSKEAVSKVLQWITDVHFYREAHAKIFRAMIQMLNEGEPVDTVSIVNQLKKQKELENVGGAYYITSGN